MKEKEPVRLRMKELADGTRSLYLDIYVGGKRSYEFLRLYLLPGTSRTIKEKNAETLALANAVKAKRIVELRNARFGFSQSDASVRLFDYIEMLKADESSTNLANVLYHLQFYEKRRNMTLDQITPRWCEGFKDYLHRQGLKPNTLRVYFRKFKAFLNKAVKEGLIASNPASRIETPKGEDTKRMFLTIDEVRILFAHRGGHFGKMKDAFLFSCLTGLRRSDVAALTWADVEDADDGSTIIRFKQKKTRGEELTYISHDARMLMGERGKDTERMFPMSLSGNKGLRRWMEQCGIKKHISFHCSRHTFATMMLTIGTDIYTTSKLLGHRSVATTQIYAKIVDEKKKAAVENIPDMGM